MTRGPARSSAAPFVVNGVLREAIHGRLALSEHSFEGRLALSEHALQRVEG